MVLGSLIKGLTGIGLWPVPTSSDDVKISVSALGEMLRGMTCHRKTVSGSSAALVSRAASTAATSTFGQPRCSGFGAPGGFAFGAPPAPKTIQDVPTKADPAAAHEKCKFTEKFGGDIQRIFNNINTGVLDEHRQHLTEQTRKRSTILPRTL